MRNCKLSIRILAAVLLLAFAAATRAQTPAKPSPAKSGPSAHKLSIEDLIEIKHPSDPVWSPDGKHIAFIWDRADIRNLYVVSADGQSKPVQLTSFPDADVHDFFWNEDSDNIYFPHEGDLWVVSISAGAAKPAFAKADPGRDFVLSPDSKRVAFVHNTGSASGSGPHGTDLVIRWLTDGAESTIAHDDVNIGRILWSPDGKSLAYTAGSKIIHHDESPQYSGAKLIYRV